MRVRFTKKGKLILIFCSRDRNRKMLLNWGCTIKYSGSNKLEDRHDQIYNTSKHPLLRMRKNGFKLGGFMWDPNTQTSNEIVPNLVYFLTLRLHYQKHLFKSTLLSYPNQILRFYWLLV